MATFLAYLEPVPGRLYPLVATLQELARRGHRIIVRSGAAEVELLRSIGISADLLAPGLARFEPRDWQAHTRFGALMRALNQFGERARPQAADLRQAVGAEQPDVLILDETSWGAAAAVLTAIRICPAAATKAAPRPSQTVIGLANPVPPVCPTRYG